MAGLITHEISKLCVLERTTLSSDLAQGFALKTLTDILSDFVSVGRIKAAFKVVYFYECSMTRLYTEA